MNNENLHNKTRQPMELLEILILIVPAVSWKLWKDRNGTTHPNNEPVTGALIMIACVSSVLMIEYDIKDSSFIFKCFAVSITGFGLLFPPLMNYILLRKVIKKYRLSPSINKGDIIYCLDHLSHTAIPDKWNFWRKLGWFGRLLVYVVFFGISLYLFW